MSGTTQGTQAGPRDRMAFALILIVVGLLGLASQVLETQLDLGGWIVLLIGLGLLGAFVYSRQYGFLVPGGILTGLGAGIIAQQSLVLTNEQSGGVVVLGLGLGFIAIWAVAVLSKSAVQHPWPLIPGGILAAIGVALLIGGGAIDMLDYWGVVAVVLGLLLLWRAWTDSRRHA